MDVLVNILLTFETHIAAEKKKKIYRIENGERKEAGKTTTRHTKSKSEIKKGTKKKRFEMLILEIKSYNVLGI